jgi:hypothetical protein
MSELIPARAMSVWVLASAFRAMEVKGSGHISLLDLLGK